jgi:hypothetical protein
MRTIYKYQIPIEDEFVLPLPTGARVLCVQVQHSVPCIWALVEGGAGVPTEDRRFALRGTGHPCDDELNGATYIGTFQLHGGGRVFHLFLRGKSLAADL